MLYVDIKTNESTTTRVAGIGTCRIRDILIPDISLDQTPNQSRGTAFSIPIWRGFSAFVHTTHQAEQYYKIFSSDIEIPKLVEPLVFNRHLDDIAKTKIENAGKNHHSTVDIYAIEVSTLNTFSWNGYYFNQNYFERNLVKAGGKPMLKWLRSLSKGSKDHEDISHDTINNLPFGSLENSADVRSLIRDTKKYIMSEDALVTSINRLKELVQKPIIIISPFILNDDKEDRIKLCSTIETAASRTGCISYNISDVINKVGRENILAGNGSDKNHLNRNAHSILLQDFCLKTLSLMNPIDNKVSKVS